MWFDMGNLQSSRCLYAFITSSNTLYASIDFLIASIKFIFIPQINSKINNKLRKFAATRIELVSPSWNEITLNKSAHFHRQVKVRIFRHVPYTTQQCVGQESNLHVV